MTWSPWSDNRKSALVTSTHTRASMSNFIFCFICSMHSPVQFPPFVIWRCKNSFKPTKNCKIVYGSVWKWFEKSLNGLNIFKHWPYTFWDFFNCYFLLLCIICIIFWDVIHSNFHCLPFKFKRELKLLALLHLCFFSCCCLAI